jgi:hypothetical protein
MFWIIAASVFAGMVLGAGVGVMSMCLMVTSSRAETMYMREEKCPGNPT